MGAPILESGIPLNFPHSNELLLSSTVPEISAERLKINLPHILTLILAPIAYNPFYLEKGRESRLCRGSHPTKMQEVELQ